MWSHQPDLTPSPLAGLLVNRLRTLAGLFALSGLTVWLWTAPVALAQQPTLVVEGEVVNSTPGGSDVFGVTVVLHQESATVHNDLETTSDQEGRFRFERIDFDPAVQYGVTVRYQGALYGRDLDLSAGSPPPITLTVYDSVDTEDVLSSSLASVLFASSDRSTQTVSALEIARIVNTSDRAYVPGPEPMKLLRFGLPPGAHGLQVDTGLRGADFIQVDRGFALLASVPPGEHEVMYTYRFPYSGTESSFTKSFIYGVEHLRVLAPEGEMRLSSDMLGGAGDVVIGGQTYQLLEASDFPRGTRISLRLEGLPRPSLAQRFDRRFDDVRFEYVGPVGLGLFMVALIGFIFWRRAKESRGGANTNPASVVEGGGGLQDGPTG